MTATLLGRLRWEGGTDEDRHRTYDIDWLVEVADAWNDGPIAAMQAPGIPSIFDFWNFGNEIDQFAYCSPKTTVKQVLTGEPSDLFIVSQTFTTKPFKKDDQSPDDPLLKPPEISGSFVKFTREATQDKDGKALKSSSFERFKGSCTERDFSRHQVSIKMPLATLPLTTYVEYIDTVNTLSMWGLSARMVKLSNVSWTRNLYGPNWALKYYDITYDFDIDFETFDRYIMDEGTKVLKSGGVVTNPKDFEPYLVKGQPAPVVLDGSGAAATSEAAIAYLQFKLYKEKNLLLLGVPTSF